MTDEMLAAIRADVVLSEVREHKGPEGANRMCFAALNLPGCPTCDADDRAGDQRAALLAEVERLRAELKATEASHDDEDAAHLDTIDRMKRIIIDRDAIEAEYTELKNAMRERGLVAQKIGTKLVVLRLKERQGAEQAGDTRSVVIGPCPFCKGTGSTGQQDATGEYGECCYCGGAGVIHAADFKHQFDTLQEYIGDAMGREQQLARMNPINHVPKGDA